MELKNHGWTLGEIERLSIPDLNDALQWVENDKAKEAARLFAGFQYHLLAQNKKGKKDAQDIYKKATKVKEINPKNRSTVFKTLMQLKAKFT